jgi:hypothetical protein
MASNRRDEIDGLTGSTDRQKGERQKGEAVQNKTWRDLIMKTHSKIISMAVAVCTLTSLTGCDSRSERETVRGVDWYERNPAEREAKLAECRANPRLLDGTPDCINASRAANNAKAGTKWATENEGVRTAPAIPPP